MKTKTRGKKALGIALCISMVLSMTPPASFAETGATAINEENFPDSVFRTYVEESFDKDGSGDLSEEEIAAATNISVSDMGIRSLSGISCFTELDSLDCSWNELTSLDLSGNTKIKELNAVSNYYTVNPSEDYTFDLSQLPSGFDINRASGWTGGSVDEETGILTPTEDTVSYTYDCGGGMSEVFTLEMGYDPDVYDMIDALMDIETVTELPASFDYRLGSGDIYTDPDGTDVYAKLLKVEIEESSILNISFKGKNEEIDTYIRLFEDDGGKPRFVVETDFISLKHYVAEPGTYYIVLSGYNDDVEGLCSAEITAEEYDGKVYERLSFISDNIPVAQEGDLWSWDEESKTLVLKDGIIIMNEKSVPAIALPDGSTIIVEGEAKIIYSGYHGIFSKGTLTIKGADDESLISIDDVMGGIVAADTIDIENCDISLDCLGGILGANIIIKDSAIDMVASERGILGGTDIGTPKRLGSALFTPYITAPTPLGEAPEGGYFITIENSSVDIISGGVGIGIQDGNITLTDSDIKIESEYIGIISSNQQSEDTGITTVSGGRLDIKSLYPALVATRASFTDVVFDLTTSDEESYFIMIYGDEEITLPGVFRLYDHDDNMVYKGEWDIEKIRDLEGPIKRAVSVHIHSWSEEWTADETHHWHECEEPYCDITEIEDMDGYEEHEIELINAKEPTETEVGYSGDKVCSVCGALIEEGSEIPVIDDSNPIPQPTDSSESDKTDSSAVSSSSSNAAATSSKSQTSSSGASTKTDNPATGVDGGGLAAVVLISAALTVSSKKKQK